MKNRRPHSILLGEDDETFRQLLASELERAGFLVRQAGTGREVLRVLEEANIDVVVLDMNMPDGTGLSVLAEVAEHSISDAAFIILTGHGSIEAAIEATRSGAFHFLTKPCPFDELDALIRRAGEHVALQRRGRSLALSLHQVEGKNRLLGDSPVMGALIEEAQKVAPTTAAVLITGASGTGKELLARSLHQWSDRREEAFLAINCAALQDSLLESELFGHERGAFTGADRRKPGLLEMADGGTLLLDELGEMSLTIQAKLLRVLQFGTFHRLGGHEELSPDVRIVATTNRDLSERIREGAFREDLYFRLNTFELRMPSLVERVGDVSMLAHRLLAKAAKNDRDAIKLNDSSLTLLEAYGWPGNVRELGNLMERIAILADSDEEAEGIIQRYIGEKRVESFETDSLKLSEVEDAHIRRVLDACGGNKTEAAKRLGIALKTLYNKLKNS